MDSFTKLLANYLPYTFELCRKLIEIEYISTTLLSNYGNAQVVNFFLSLRYILTKPNFDVESSSLCDSERNF